VGVGAISASKTGLSSLNSETTDLMHTDDSAGPLEITLRRRCYPHGYLERSVLALGIGGDILEAAFLCSPPKKNSRVENLIEILASAANVSLSKF
jgi:hypothetical protein